MIPKKIISDFDPAAGNYFLYDADGVVRIESLDQSQPFGKALIERYNSHEELQQATKELKEALKDALPYVKGAYECAFPDESENDYVRDNIEALLTKYKDL